jgi:membrane protein DedA with SNARE-associated domain
MSATMVISKIIALGMIYLGYWFWFNWKIEKNNSSNSVWHRWSAGLMLLLIGLAILLDNADIFNLPKG